MSSRVQTVDFPFAVTWVDFEVRLGVPVPIPEKGLVLCIDDSRLPWSEGLGSNYAYVGSDTEDGTLGTRVHFSTPRHSVNVRVSGWGRSAESITRAIQTLVVSAEGMLGEEMRIYRISYELPVPDSPD
jgi:hypothetical protein